LKQRSKIDGLEAPVEEISTCWPFGGVLPVDVQKKPIVRTHVNPEVWGNR